MAGAPITPFWEWRCPGHECHTRLTDRDEARLANRGRQHYLEQHGPIDGQEMLELEL